jgi:hypothetical protein
MMASQMGMGRSVRFFREGVKAAIQPLNRRGARVQVGQAFLPVLHRRMGGDCVACQFAVLPLAALGALGVLAALSFEEEDEDVAS